MHALRPITEIAARLGLTDDLLEPYGRHTAKIRLEALESLPGPPRPAGPHHRDHADRRGEGKTVNTIGLTQGLAAIGKECCGRAA